MARSALTITELNDDDLRRDPLEVRKATLASIVAKAGPGIRFNEHIEGDGPTVFPAPPTPSPCAEDIGSALKGGVNVCQRQLVKEVLGPLVTEFVPNFGCEGATPIQRGSNASLLHRVRAVRPHQT
jgi:hypothetical protein